MDNLIQSFKNNEIYNIYLFFGEEDFLIDFYVKKLKDKFVKNDDEANYFFINEDNYSDEKIINHIVSYSFLSEYKFIYINFDNSLEKTYKIIEGNYQNIPKNNILLIRDKTADKRKKSYKFIEKNGLVVDFKKLDEDKITKWIIKKLGKKNINISSTNAKYILSKVGNDMYTLNNEIDKIISFISDKNTVNMSDVDEIVSYKAEDRVFELIDYISNRDIDKAMDAYNDLLSLNEPPMKILALIFRNYNILYQMKDIEDITNKEILKRIGIPVFFARKYKFISSKFSFLELREIINELYNIDYNIKIGNMTDRTSLELFILKQCKGY